MKKLITLFVLFLCTVVTRAQYVNIPDSGFRFYLKSKYPSCFNAASQMDTSCSAIVNERYLFINSTVFNFSSGSLIYILNVEGIQYFKNLDTLFFSASYVNNIPSLPNHIKTLFLNSLQNNVSLPALPLSLQYFNFSNNVSITTLPELPAGLQFFNCGSNFQLNNLPALPSSIQTLYISGNNQLSSLPALPASLREFQCHGNFSSLPELPQSLRDLQCSGSFLSLPAFPAFLKRLTCSFDSNLTSLPVFSPNITYIQMYAPGLLNLPALPAGIDSLYINGSKITTLAALPGTLRFLDCSNNRFLTTITNLPSSLKRLECQSGYVGTNTYLYGLGQITNLPPLPNGLVYLNCSGNRIQSISQIPPAMDTLCCANNLLTGLPSASNGVLKAIFADSNLLTSLPILPNSVSTIRCRGNNISCFPVIPDNPYYRVNLLYDYGEINCVPNYPRHGIYFNETPSLSLPLCNPTNNINHCQSFPVMQGSVFFDDNNNGVKDMNERIKSNNRVNLSNNYYTFTNNDGLYEIGAYGIGNYSLSTVAPRYYRYVPASYNFNFTSYDTMVTNRNFALQIDSIVDELAIRITPVNWAARPGFSFPYLISYENTGTTTLSSNIIFDYDQTKLNYDTSSEADVVDNTDILAFSTGSLVPGQSGSFIGYFTLKTTVPLGDTLIAKTSISANAFTAYDSVQTIVRGAFDPNDKQATPQLSPSQVANGEYIDYIIRFQNTGTDTAFTVVISDTLSDDLQANTLQMIASSHNCKATVKDNVVFFEFLNILLPDSNINEPKSHGFVSFRIKPQTNVSVNTTITNKAAIYFDYNAPVITNTAGTLIKEFTVVPLELISFSAVPQNDNTTSLYWNTANEINTKHFVIERSNDGLRFTSVINVFAKGKANNNYNTTVVDANTGIIFYRLKMVDNDGSFVYSPIIKIDKRKNAAGFSVLRNPVKDVLVISTTDRTLNNTQANIINMQGAAVKTFTIKEGSQTVDITDLSKGVYYLRTANGSRRVVVQ